MQDFQNKSFWLSSLPYDPNHALQGEHKADVAIVGGGFTGLSAAYHLKKLDPGLKVVLLESAVIAFGASGRNAGFALTLFGLTFGLTVKRFGKENAKQAHHYMEEAVDLVGRLVQENNIDCEYERPGFLRVAISQRHKDWILQEMELMHSLGIQGIEWLEEKEVKEQVYSPRYLGAWWEPRCALLNPAKLAWGMKKVIQDLGVEIYENSPVQKISKKNNVVLQTDQGSLRAEKLVLATNAFSVHFPELRRKQTPAFTYIVLTEPLPQEQLQWIGWQNRQGIEDARNLVHYYRLTADNRLLMGGSDVGFYFGLDLERDRNENTFEALQNNVRETFPVLEDVSFTHQWGGPVSIPLDMAPALGYLGDKRTVYSLGGMGHGVSLTHLNGATIADLILERSTKLSRMFFVNRWTIPWPWEPLRFVLGNLVRGYMRLEDKWVERKDKGRGKKRSARN